MVLLFRRKTIKLLFLEGLRMPVLLHRRKLLALSCRRDMITLPFYRRADLIVVEATIVFRVLDFEGHPAGWLSSRCSVGEDAPNRRYATGFELVLPLLVARPG